MLSDRGDFLLFLDDYFLLLVFDLLVNRRSNTLVIKRHFCSCQFFAILRVLLLLSIELLIRLHEGLNHISAHDRVALIVIRRVAHGPR